MFFLLLLQCWGGGLSLYAQALYPEQLRCEFADNPLGVDTDHPVFSWTFRSRGRNTRQLAYEIKLATDSADFSKGPDWNTGKVLSGNNTGVIYNGKALRSFTRYYWKVKVYDQQGKPSSWSRTAWFETAALDPDDWKGSWISDGSVAPEKEADFYKEQPAPLFRKQFSIGKRITAARLYITGLGFYEPYINGKKISPEMLAPGWTSFDKTVLYRSHDITALLTQGVNVAGVMLGNGWYNPLPMRMWGARNLRNALVTGQPCVKAMIRLQFADGTTAVMGTDTTWETAPGPVLRNNVYLGEHYDARAAPERWYGSGKVWSSAKKAVAVKGPAGRLTAQLQPGITVTKKLRPVTITEIKPGVFIADMGQNFAGVAHIRLRAPAGTRVVLRYGEALYKDGTLNVMTSVAGQVKSGNGGPGAPQVAWQEDVYTAAGNGEETWAPGFTFHGFRYVEITGWPGRPGKDDIEGWRMNAAVEETGRFTTSNPMFNKLAENIRWTFLSNLFSVQSDCPAREKFGYGGDMFCTANAFSYYFDMANFYRKVLQDHEDAQRPSGGITETAPYVGISDAGPDAQSGPLSFQIGFPYVIKQVYDFYGDRRIIARHYAALKKQAQFLTDSSKGHLYEKDLGDHESLDEKPVAFMASCFYYHHMLLMKEFAGILNEKEDERKYGSLADTIKAAIVDRFYNDATGRFDNGTQSAQFVGLWYGLVSGDSKQRAIAAMKQAVAEKKEHLSTGIFGTKMLFDVLRENDLNQLAYTIADQRDFPGWGAMIAGGATTLWETWKYSDNTYSQNHPMFGSVGEWFYRSLLGINAGAAGFRKIIIKPQPAGDLAFAEGSYASVAGVIKSGWNREGGRYRLKVTIPANTTAEIWITAKKNSMITEGGRPLKAENGIRVIRRTADYAVVATGSGEYQFETAGVQE
ncbi:glycoside hydrolase family 78 protein [Niabella sp. 3A5MI-3]|nr:glycoside hydrolase family 78 protein [Niabella beijingensis]